MNEVKVTHALPGGGTITITIRTIGPITEKEFPILGAEAAWFAGESAIQLARSVTPAPRDRS